MPTIEDIILQKDGRNMAALRPYLPNDFATEAAQLILDHPRKVLIISGFHIITVGAPETDGPPGAIAIGNALGDLGYDVAYVTDEFSSAVMGTIARDGHRVIEFPVADHRGSADFAHGTLLDEAPSVLISIERCGVTASGDYKNFRGVDISEFNARVDHLFEQHPISIGIGDGGNEIGMGNLKDVIPQYDRLPDDPCVTTTTKLMIAAVSNWGGYGLVAALSRLGGKNLLPSVDLENEWLEAIVEAGAVEGMTGEPKPWVDGFPPDENSVCLRDLHAMLAAEGI